MTGRAFVLSLLLVTAASAQLNRGSSETTGRIRIRLAFPDHAPCTASTRVALIGNTGFALAETNVNGECVADFFDVPAGKYRVNVSGGDASSTDDEEIEAGALSMQEVEIHARHTGNTAGDLASATFISVSDLGVPSSAAKEFGKANRMIAKQDWSSASDRLQKAVAIYPTYASAYNNLGAVYSRLGNWKEARTAFEQAIALNDHLGPAYLNLARVDFNEKDFADAEPLLEKASSLSAPTADELNLLAYAELMNGHLDHAVETSRRGHAAQVAHHAFLHLIAAHVYELQRKIGESVVELQMYLKEEPAAPQIAEVKKALATLQMQQSGESLAGPS
jgi:tetratricopeptide (TPR) repeat protein